MAQDVAAQANAAHNAGQHVDAQAQRLASSVGRVVDPWKKAAHAVTTHAYKGLKTPEGKAAYPGNEFVRMTPGLRSGLTPRASHPGSSIPSADVMPNRGKAVALFLAHHASGGGLGDAAAAHIRTTFGNRTPPVSGEQFSPGDMPPPASPPMPPPVNPWGGRPGSQPIL